MNFAIVLTLPRIFRFPSDVLSQKEKQFPKTNILQFLLPMQMIRKLKDIFRGFKQEKQHHSGRPNSVDSAQALTSSTYVTVQLILVSLGHSLLFCKMELIPALLSDCYANQMILSHFMS